jgi:long-chain acyl-CoA synthetase
MISHRNFVSCVYLADQFAIDLDENDTAISYLPYGHTFEQAIFVFSLFKGFSHGYYSGDPLKLLEDINVLKPTIFCTVPRILNRVYSKIHESIATKGKFTQWLFNRALESKKYYYEKDGNLKYGLYDFTVFNKIKAQFGGNVRFMISASAPISQEVLSFYKLALGIHVYEVYGQSETNGPATVTHPLDRTGGHVGGVIPSMRIRLRDVPELGYLTSDNPPRGEVQFCGTNVFKGYFKNPEKT